MFTLILGAVLAAAASLFVDTATVSATHANIRRKITNLL